jgi:beta-glucosidase/6-phospho-beta-glucosidase/beta-galactosidase
MDNFEWNSGLVPRFGSVHVDFNTFERRPKKSAYFVTEVYRRKPAEKFAHE